MSSFQLFYGKLYSLFSIKIVYLVAIALFEIGSLVCTTAPNSAALVIGRAIAGLGAAGIFSGGILITTKTIPLARRAAYLGIMSGVFGVAAILGPFIGGALIDSTTWRWCFGINLPLGVVTVVICAFLVQTPVQPEIESFTVAQKLRKLDIPGTVLMVASLICLLVALQWGGSTYAWDNSRIIALFVVAAVLAIAFVAFQTLSRFSTTIPTAVARNRDVWLAATYAMSITGGVYTAILYLPIWFQTVRDYSALSSGTMLTPLIGGYVVCSVIAGGVTMAVGYYNPGMILGSVLAIAGSALLTTINTGSSTARVIGYQLLYGFGVGFAFGQPSYVVQTVLPASDVPIGVTLITLVQDLSASVFVAVAQSIFQDKLRSHLQAMNLPGSINVSSTGAAQIVDAVPPEFRDRVVEGLSQSLVTTFYVSLALSCASIIGAVGTRWRSMKAGEADKGEKTLSADGTSEQQAKREAIAGQKKFPGVIGKEQK